MEVAESLAQDGHPGLLVRPVRRHHGAQQLLFENVSEVRMLTTLYLAKSDDRWVIFITGRSNCMFSFVENLSRSVFAGAPAGSVKTLRSSENAVSLLLCCYDGWFDSSVLIIIGAHFAAGEHRRAGK